MKQEQIVKQLRRFLTATVAAIFLGSIVELILLEHYEETLQWIPFITSGLGLIAVITIKLYLNKKTVRFFQSVMALTAVVSLVGIWLHFQSNLSFIQEINPSFTLLESIWPALKGSHPLLAPGILFLGGILGLAATYKHPILHKGAN